MSLPSVSSNIGDKLAVNVTVNGTAHSLSVDPRRSLADVIREEVGLTGTHLGCEHGVCGACTVLVDGAPSRSCLMLGAMADGREITTVEGLADNGVFNHVQQGMWDAMSFQCAFCSPGFIMSTMALLEENPNPTDEEIREELSGNLCRCTGYTSIVDGVKAAIDILNGTDTNTNGGN